MEIENRQSEHQEERKDLKECQNPGGVSIKQGHGKEVKHIHLKGQKDQSIDIIIEVKPDPCSGKRTHAALIGHAHLLAPGTGREEKRARQGTRGHENTNEEEKQDGYVQPVKNH